MCYDTSVSALQFHYQCRCIIITIPYQRKQCYELNLKLVVNKYSVTKKKLKYSPLWSSGQSFWLQIQRSRVRFPALPDFLSSSGSGTGSTQPREVN